MTTPMQPAPSPPSGGPAPPARPRRALRGVRRDRPRRLGDLPSGAWGRIAKRTFDRFRSDSVTNLAAALTYRAILSLFPGLIALVALLGLVGQYPQTFDAVLKVVGRIAPPSTVQSISGPLQAVITNKGGAGALLGVGLAGAVWAASGYVGAFSWATNVIWEARRGRSWYRQWPFNIAVTVVGLVLLSFVLLVGVASGPIAEEIGRQLGIGPTAVTVWGIAKWPVAVAVVTALISGLFYIAPNVRQPAGKWLTPGVLFAVAAWALLSVGFGFYVAHFGSFDRTYGTLGAVVTFLVWVWWTNIAILLGVELDSEIERERQLTAGWPDAEEHIEMKLRQS
jgi:membrane protein